MKALALLTIICAMVLRAKADSTNPLENFSPHFSTNTEIIWQAPTNQLPKKFWTYRRLLPRIFSETIISNAIVLASLQNKGFPKPSTNDYWIPAFYPPPNYPGMVPTIFGIRPSDASLYYSMPNSGTDSDVLIPNHAAIAAHAWNYARQLGIDPSNLILKKFYTYYCDTNQNPNERPNHIYGRSVFLSRKLDEVSFLSGDDRGDGAEGFFIEFGNYGIVRSFTLQWSDVERCEEQLTASPNEIIQCIRARKIMVLPGPNEEWYFKRVEKLETAKKLVISKITPYYMDNVFGQAITENEPSKYIAPMAELEATADFGDSNMIIRVLAPITSPDAHRLLGK